MLQSRHVEGGLMSSLLILSSGENSIELQIVVLYINNFYLTYLIKYRRSIFLDFYFMYFI